MFQGNLSIRQLDRICIITIAVIVCVCGYLAISHLTKKKQQFSIEKEILSKIKNIVLILIFKRKNKREFGIN